MLADMLGAMRESAFAAMIIFKVRSSYVETFQETYIFSERVNRYRIHIDRRIDVHCYHWGRDVACREHGKHVWSDQR